MTRRRTELVYLNGRLLLEGEGRDFVWPDGEELPTPAASSDLRDGDRLVVLDAPVHGADRRELVRSSGRWVDTSRPIADVLGELEGVVEVRVEGEPIGGIAAVIRGGRAVGRPVAVLETAVGVDLDELGERVRGELVALGHLVRADLEVLVRPRGAEGDLLEASWRLGGA